LKYRPVIVKTFPGLKTINLDRTLSCHVPKPMAGMLAPVLSLAVVIEAILRICCLGMCEEIWETREVAVAENRAVRANILRRRIEKS